MNGLTKNLNSENLSIHEIKLFSIFDSKVKQILINEVKQPHQKTKN